MRGAGDGVTPADGGQREPESKQVGERKIERTPAAGADWQRRYRQHAPGRVVAHRGDGGPDRQDRQNPDRNPDAACDAVRRHVVADAGTNPQQAGDADRRNRREVFRPDVAGEAPAGDRRQRHGRGVLANEDACECREEQPFDEIGGRRSLRGAGAKGLMHAGDDAARDQERPALDVDGADERSDDRRGQYEPRGRLADCRARRAGNEERGNAELSDGQRRRLAHRHERQQGRR